MCLPQLRLSPYLATARAVAQPRRMSGAASEAAELRHPILQLALWSLPAPQLHEPSEQSTALDVHVLRWLFGAVIELMGRPGISWKVVVIFYEP